jgi:hypothetical protein
MPTVAARTMLTTNTHVGQRRRNHSWRGAGGSSDDWSLGGAGPGLVKSSSGGTVYLAQLTDTLPVEHGRVQI